MHEDGATRNLVFMHPLSPLSQQIHEIRVWLVSQGLAGARLLPCLQGEGHKLLRSHQKKTGAGEAGRESSRQNISKLRTKIAGPAAILQLC